MTNMKIIIFGPPGSGKGTLAELFCNATKIISISTGNMFREHIAKQDELGKQVKELIDKGEFVPDEITIEIVKKRLAQEDVKESFLLDGFPRTLKQASSLLEITTLTGAIFIHLEDEEVIRRVSRRRVCPICGASYHLDFKKPKEEGLCDIDKEKLIIREDDKPEIVVKRLQEYKERTEPIIDLLKEKNIAMKIVRGDYDIKTESQGIIDDILSWQQSLVE